jgi:ubiquinone/menaquinone biosynthesis C-methylase UbiE
MFAKFIANQLSSPSYLIGRLVLAPLWNKRNVALNDVVLDSLNLRWNDRVLEVGFGGGYLLGRMAEVVTHGSITGVDPSKAMVTFCEGRFRSLIIAGKLGLMFGAAESLPYPSGYFSKVCTVNSIFYFQDVRQAISEMCRVLEGGGKLVICLTCKPWMENKSFAPHGIALYEEEEIFEMVEGAGLKLIGVKHAFDKHREFMSVIGEK